MPIFEHKQSVPMIIGGPSGKPMPRSSVREGTVTLSSSEPTAKEQRKWVNAQIAYENLATNADVARRALNFSIEHRKQFDEKMTGVYKRWRLISHMMRGNSVADTWGLEPIHVPEVYKAREALVTRIEEAVLQYDPNFEVKGRDRLDRKRADVLRSWLQYLLAECDFEASVQPGIRSMLDTQLLILKWRWDYRERDGVEVTRKPIKNKRTGLIDTKITRKRTREVIANQPAYDIIDPFNFLIDTCAFNEQKALIIGDETYLSGEEIRQLGEVGIYKNTAKLEEVQPSRHSATQAEINRNARSVTERFAQGREPPEGGAKKYRVSERWGPFDLYGSGREVECVITTIEDTLVVRAMENFYDSKMRPYAVARVSEEAFDFINVSPFDHSIALNAELDAHRTLALESHKISVCPHVSTESEGADLPDSILGILPGHVFQGAKLDWMRPPDTLASWPAVEEMLKRDIQETCGSPSLFLGAYSGGTATETERRLQEANKRVLGLIRAYARFYKKCLEILYQLSAQFVTRRKQFRVLGRATKILGEHAEVSPMDFESKIDFEIIGMTQLHTIGTRAAAIANYTSRNAQMLLQYADRVDIPALLAEDFRLTVGTRHEEEIIKVDRSLDDLMTPEEENIILMQGEKIDVHPMDPTREHIVSHEVAKNEALDRDNWQAVAAFDAHVLEHKLTERKKQLQQQASQGRPPSVAQSNLPQNGAMTEPADFAGAGSSPGRTPRGESAGPPQAGKQGNVGRSQPSVGTDQRGGSR